MKDNIVEDGFGGSWYKCSYEDCDLAVMRPGKVRCSACDVDSLRACRDMSRMGFEEIIAKVAGTPMEAFVRARYHYIFGGGQSSLDNPFIEKQP